MAHFSASASIVSMRIVLATFLCFALVPGGMIEAGACSIEDIRVTQAASRPLPNGIPTYGVVITNSCSSGCSIADIHIRCGWYSSARLVDPKVFRRLGYNDCLVNDGKPLAAGSSVSFEYANEDKYPMDVSSVKC